MPKSRPPVRKRTATTSPASAPKRNLAAIPHAFLLCRDLRHAWDEPVYLRGFGGGVTRVLTCIRCGTERHDAVTFSGRRTGQRYKHPEGYLSPAGAGRLDPEKIRARLLATAVVREVG